MSEAGKTEIKLQMNHKRFPLGSLVSRLDRYEYRYEKDNDERFHKIPVLIFSADNSNSSKIIFISG